MSQLEQGGSADVFASADEVNMQKAVDGHLIAGTPSILARNRLEIVVERGNPKRVRSLQDLARQDLIVITTAPQVPAGKYAAQVLAAAGVTVTPRSQETDVKSVVSKVELGEADAGIVYSTDVSAAGSRVSGVVIPDDQNIIAVYPIARPHSAPNPGAGQAFIEYLLSDDGQRLLGTFGFLHR